MSNDGGGMVDQEFYPFESQRMEVSPGVEMHYLDEGPKDAPVLIMVHGNPTWSFYYRNLVIGLREQYRCIVPDHIGCGLSDKPQQGYEYCLANRVDNLNKLVESLDINKFSLIVHDWGGAIGMGLARLHPEALERLVILNTAAFYSPTIPFRIAICRMPLIGTWINRGLNGFAKAAITMAVSRKTLSSNVAAGFLAPYNNWQNRIAIDSFVQDIPMEESHPSRSTLNEIEASLPQFKDLPIHIYWGMKDFCFNETFLNRWREIFPMAEVQTFADAGHYILEDAGDEILSSLKNFLSKPTYV